MQKPDNGSGPVTLTVVIGSTCLTIFLFQKILWLVVPFLLAILLFYLLAPFSRKLIMAGATPGLAAALLSGAFLLAIAAMLLLLYPLVIANGAQWQANLLRYVNGGTQAVENLVAGLQKQFDFLRNSELTGTVDQKMFEITDRFSAKQVFQGIMAWLPSLLMAPVITFFLLKDGNRLRKFIGSAVPNAYFEKTLYLMHALNRTARLYFIGLISLVAIDVAILSGGLWLIGAPAPLAMGLISGLLGLIPSLGTLVGCVITAVVTVTEHPNNLPLLYGVLGVFAVSRVLDDLFFMPYVFGKVIRVHALLTLMMFFIGEAIAGVAGLVLVMPILGVLLVIGETMGSIFSDERLRARNRFAKELKQLQAARDLTME